jgi:hypothetical protein
VAIEELKPSKELERKKPIIDNQSKNREMDNNLV